MEYNYLLSICMMVKDEEKNIRRCLDAMRYLIDKNDVELIIVDRTTYNIGAPYPDCGEIDIMEHVNSNDYTNAAIHWEGSSGLTSRIYYTDDCIDAFDVTEYHVYAIEWTEEQILFLVDNNGFGTFNLLDTNSKILNV